MPRYLLAILAAALPASAFAADRALKVPPGFEVAMIAGPPLVQFPVAAALDEHGRLYVTEMAGPITREEVAAKKPAHRIVRLEDTNGDGTFDKATTFADGLSFPEGILYLGGAIYTACPPQILKLTDTDGDGKADKREVWFDGGTLTGCANDLHGPYRGPDGYIYWCKGAFAKQEHTLADGRRFVTRASHIFRAKPDGSNLDVVMTGGMDNPVDVVFTPAGERIFSTTFFQHPADGKRDGLIHAVYGGIYGKDHDPLYDPAHKWTSPNLMPVLTHMGPAAPCGLHRYESDQLGPDYRDNVFCCQFNLHMVSRHVLVPKGATFETKDSPFVTSDDVDFHPTDVIEAADGSLIVLDTGGWYKLCCPSSQLVKADVYGGIYRVRRTGSHKAQSKPAPRPLPRLYTIALNRDRGGLGEAIAGLAAADLHTRRLAAEACGRIGDPAAVPAILAALADEQNDRVLDHSLTYALIEIGEPKATAAGLQHKSPRVRRAALAALANIPGEQLDAKTVLAELSAADLALRETAWWVAAKRPEWGGQLAGSFRDRIAMKLSDAERDELVTRLAKFAANDAIRKLLADAAADPATAAVALRSMARSGVRATPEVWLSALTTALGSPSPGTVREAVAAARALPTPKAPPKPLAEALLAIGRNAKQPDAIRLAALAAVPGGPPADETLFAFALAKLRADEPAVRAAAAEVLTKAALNPPQLTTLTAALGGTSPTDLPRLLDAFAKSKDEAVGRALVAALNTPAVRPSLRADTLKPILAKYPAAVQTEAAKLYAELDRARATELERLSTLETELPKGDIRRGQVIFNSTKAACVTCHKIGYVGGTVGPDLTRIGGIRTERDLLESVVFPSASFVRSYEPVKLETKDGQTHSGILKKDAPDEVILVVAADKEVRVARDDIETMKPSTVSVMPAGLDQQLTKQELADLIAFLRACK